MEEFKPTFETAGEAEETIGLKEVVTMMEETLAEAKAEEETVNQVLDDLYMDPLPDLHDEEAKLAYRDKMERLLSVAKAQHARADVIQSIERRLKEKMDSLEEAS
jgi:alanine-alpha-ketoisovalerate/valine-pyruvate aminotransferase